MRKRLITVMALITGLMMVASVAVAQDAPEALEESDIIEETDANGTVLRGRGRLFARGPGHVVLNMDGTLRLRLHGNAVITDLTGDATIVVDDGPETDFASASDGGTKLVLTNFNGWIYIEGSRFKVNARGGMAFVAKGKGWAFLQGEGVWRTRRNHGVWSQGGDRYKIG